MDVVKCITNIMENFPVPRIPVRSQIFGGFFAELCMVVKNHDRQVSQSSLHFLPNYASIYRQRGAEV
jgi:hypothetical protein